MTNGATEVRRKMMQIRLCAECKKDEKVFYPRDADGECLHCGIELCAAHLIQHFSEVHCISLNLDHCSKRVNEP